MTRRQLPQQITKITVPERGTGNPVVRYEVRADAGINPETGKRHQIRRRYRTEKEARAALVKFLADAAAGEFVPRKDVTVEQVCVDWFGSLHWARPTTIAGYEYNLAPLREKYGELPVQKLTRKHLDDLVSALKAGGTETAKGNRRRPWAARSLKRTVETIAMVLDYAMERKLVSHNVAKSIKPKSGRKRKPKTYTAAEVQTFLASLDGDRDAHLWFLALCGLRRGELGGLRWSGVDFKAKTLTVHIGRAAAGGKAVEDDPKTEASERTLPMDDEMVAVLRRARRRQAADKLQLGEAYQDGDYVACNEDGTPYHPDTITHRWGKAVKRAGLRHIRLHDARHTCGTTMHLRKVPMAVIAAWLGHADASVTARIYAHSQDEALREAARTLGEVVSSRVIDAS
ncbi:site-specific integrase [Nocardia cyriacigeorgica]|uniref:Site-specific integrase n=1 Tax=Nocardia cyriacigeorgica TaxID=135487 RepID=A0A6P1CKS6_9NOCA|nr:site-specific integrase [Nocardia cyriacigeorgica]NEW31914.1 site-specific integrase [Nocardia cyriacigeorgica]BDU04963.1 integrase [Nocardia cyriacigeorgica]